MRSAGFGNCFKLRKFIGRRVRISFSRKTRVYYERRWLGMLKLNAKSLICTYRLSAVTRAFNVELARCVRRCFGAATMRVLCSRRFEYALNTIERVRRVFNPSLEIQGVVLTMADQRNNLTEQVAADVREHLGEKVYETVIPRNVRVSEAPSHGLPALVYDLRVRDPAYIHLAGEVIRRERSIAK